MGATLSECAWPESLRGEMVAALVRHAGLPGSNGVAAGDGMEACCAAAGLECERVPLVGGEWGNALKQLAPGALPIADQGYLLVLGCGSRFARVLTPALETKRVRVREVRDLISAGLEAKLRPEMEEMLNAAGVPEQRRRRALRAMLDHSLSDRLLGHAWQFRVRPGADFRWQIREAGLYRRLLIFGAAHACEIACLIAAWAAIGRGALSGGIGPAWLAAWALLLFTAIPFRLLTTWSQGVLAVGIGGLLKQRLLAGALLSDPDSVRGQGTGQLLGRVLESEALQSLALGGGLATLLAAFEAALALALMTMGAASIAQPLLFAAWIVSMTALAYAYYRARLRWTGTRLSLTHGLVERMAGHRTRLAQQPRAEQHVREDDELERYIGASRRLDRAGAGLAALPGRVWLLLSLAALAGPFWSKGQPPARMAISLGAMLLGYQAMRRFGLGAAQLSGAAVAWKQVAPMFHQAAGAPSIGIAERTAAIADAAVIEARELSYRYPGHGEPALDACSLRIAAGDMVLLEGSSGGGKSTLAAVLAGLRTPDSGALLANQRRSVVAAPQYHENHVFAAPLAFNLLMGRRWPATPEDLGEAEEVCDELGLKPLLARMPGGLMQMVGETGWQLSQGERSRVFLARALLQGGELVILDETFAALDPESLRQAMDCALRRAHSLLVIAHP